MIRLAACLALAAAATAPASADGRALFSAHGCSACHRVGPDGGSAGPDLTLVGVRRPRAWIEQWLKSPRAWKPDTLMPEQGLSDADRGALADYLSEQKGQAWNGTPPWANEDGLARGGTIYVRAGCVACHGTAGRGGQPDPGAPGGLVPALAPLVGNYTRAELIARVSGGVPAEPFHGVMPAVAMPAWKDVLGPADLDALATYLLSLAEGQPKPDW